ncbi:CAP domain-containing protein [Natronolimnohabitans sp. A-GB9]|uniref:CAP domain-containing protein n=1 Tax=Natronolimnohabitans sp. A-GB9 TaxID=3069757 RepID=UPI0027B0C2B5|nr:CAP domain-containing protein [Natronolimnohabitans sp. A-GB9]MDQ2050085.1 CAP domain-containing protein [Natronolimnohabitans sp. A-GB9]
MIGVGAAAPGSNTTDGASSVDSAVVSQSNVVDQADETSAVDTADDAVDGSDTMVADATAESTAIDPDIDAPVSFLEDVDIDDIIGTETGDIVDEIDDETPEDGPDEEPEADDETDDVDRVAVEQYVHEAVNEERADADVNELEFDTELRDIARAHSEDMAERGYFSHEDPEGNDFTDRYEEAGYECDVDGYVGGENIAQTWYDTPVDTDDRDTVHYEGERELGYGVVEQWMNSPGHTENLLADQWESQGIGVYVTDDDQVFVTQNFC